MRITPAEVEVVKQVLELRDNRDRLAAQRDELRTIIRAAIDADPNSVAARVLRTANLEKRADI